jgi:hypothetical protein
VPNAGNEGPVHAVCHCPLGFEGKFCENAIDIEVGCDTKTVSNMHLSEKLI